MTHRMLSHICAASALLGMLAGGAAGQIGQQGQQRPQQQRPAQQTSPVNGKDFLQDLQGDWNVKVTIYDVDAVEGVRMSAGLQQFQTQLEQVLTRHGVDREDARSKAQDIVQSCQHEQSDQEGLREKLKDALEDAGLSSSEAEREAQRLAPQLHRQLQQQGVRQQPGQRPGTGQRPGIGERPGQQSGQQPGQQHGQRPGQHPGQQHGQIEREAQYEAEGTASRSWMLDETFLQEELNFTVTNKNNSKERTGEGHINLRSGDEFKGMALFAFEPINSELCVVWGDNTRSTLHYGMAQYDSAEQSMIFYNIDADRVRLPQAQTRPGMAPMQRSRPGGPQVGQERPGTQDRHDFRDRQPGMMDGEQLRLDQQGSRIVLRVVDDNEHIVQVYRANPRGQASRIMEITYTRNN